MPANTSNQIPLYERIYHVVSLIPHGKVATYGQISRIVGRCNPRMVGYAMSALRESKHKDVPWQRVINSQGKVSVHGDGIGSTVQHELLIAEGVEFDEQGKTNFNIFGWNGPDFDWESTLNGI
ncbi:MAG: MGMT family protein [Anaerolineaceae bacterium]|nr:MGMT family protein [Anaerolineaceae bacterium]